MFAIIRTLVVFILLLAAPASALVTGQVGNQPIRDGNFPLGALDVANLKTRLAWWDGPLAGNMVFLYRGTEADLQQALDLFAKIRAPELRVIVREGRQESFFLKSDKNPNVDAHIDWQFTLWDPEAWHRLYNNPTSIWSRSDSHDFRRPVAPPTMEIYIAGEGEKDALDFGKIKLPAGITLLDCRATANGFKQTDGSVVKGDVYDMLTAKPIANARIAAMTYKEGGKWEEVGATVTDADGRFELTNLGTDTRAVHVAAKGYAARNLGYVNLGKHGFRKFTVELSPPAPIVGIVVDTNNKPLAGVKLRADSVLGLDGIAYTPATTAEATTDADGKFQFPDLPRGYLNISAFKENFYNVDPLKIHRAPAPKLTLQMTATGGVKGKLLGAEGDMHVHMNPPGSGDDLIGKWGGSMMVKEDGTFEFKNIPPGVYIISPNFDPSTKNDPRAKTITIKPGEVVEVELSLRK